MAHVNQYPFQAEMGVKLLSPLEQYVNCENFHGQNICILQYFPMKFCSKTNFDALFPSVVIDFPFLYLNQYFEIAKFVYCFVVTEKEIETPHCGNFLKMYSILWICRIQWCGFL